MSGRPVLRTTICELLGIEYPVLLAGMGPTIGDGPKGIAGPELVAAVSNAGGLGVLGGTGLRPEAMESQINRIRELTDRPFGVDILLPSLAAQVPDVSVLPDDLRTLVPEEHRAGVERIRTQLELPEAHGGALDLLSFSPAEQVDVITSLRVPVLATGLGNPSPYAEKVHGSGGTIISLVGTPSAAKEVVDGGADLVVAQGHEAGGHTGRIGTMALLPQVIDAVAPIPVVAAGGIGDGRGLAAALAMGCVGAWCGTVFIGAEEAELDPVRKKRILEAPADGTRVTRFYSGKTMRNVNNQLIEAWEASELKALPMGLQSVLVGDLIAAARVSGRNDLLMNAAGQICGIVDRLRPAAEILEEMVREAAAILVRYLPERVEAKL